MIRVRDSFTLALTKLRTRKIRLFVTILISGLLLINLVLSSLIARGVFQSIGSFSEEGFGNRFILQGSAIEQPYIVKDQELIKKAEQLHASIISQKKASAKKLDLAYDSAQEELPVIETYPGSNEKILNPLNQAARKVITDYLENKQKNEDNKVQESFSKYGLKDKYASYNLPFSQSSNLRVLKDGKETYEESGSMNSGNSSYSTETMASSWKLFDKELLEPFKLDNTELTVDANGAIPIIAPVSAVEQLLKLESLPINAKAEERLERLRKLRAESRNITFSVCWRNEASRSDIDKVISQKKEISSNSTNKEYVKPSVIYEYPDEPCGPIKIVKDTRTTEEKDIAAKEQKFKQEFEASLPRSQVLKFRVVGLSPQSNNGQSSNVSGLIASLMSSALGGDGWFTPTEVTEQIPIIKEMYLSNPLENTVKLLILEFSDAKSALAALEGESCKIDYSAVSSDDMTSYDPLADCIAKNKNYYLEPFGSSSLALDSAKDWFNKIFIYYALVIASLSAIIMIGTVGRIIADSRRETAVFRAIGAKRIDIAQIYFAYVLAVSLLIFVLSTCLAIIIAMFINNKYSSEVTSNALLIYNSKDLSRVFTLFNINVQDILSILGLTLVAGFISALLPMATNIRRNPIKDMRDEN